MQAASSVGFLGDPNFDPNTLTTFGSPPFNSVDSEKDQTTAGTRIGAFFGAFTSAIWRKDDLKSDGVNLTEGQTSDNENIQDSQLQQTQMRNNNVLPDSSSVESSRTQRISSGYSKFTAFFRKAPPVSVGLNAKWATDEACRHCYSCGMKFSTFFRRHHCRFCGRIFCDPCSKFRIPGQPFGVKDALRSCEVCYRETLKSLLEKHYDSLSEDVLQKIASLYAAINTVQGQATHLQAPSSAPVNVHSPQGPVTSPNPSCPPQSSGVYSGTISNASQSEDVVLDPLRHMSLSRAMTMTDIVDIDYGDEDEYDTGQGQRRHQNRYSPDDLPQFSELKDIFETAFQPNSGFNFETHRSLAKTYYNCFTGNTLLNWLMERDHELSSFQAAAIAKAMLDCIIIMPLSNSANAYGLDRDEIFIASSYYRPGRAAGFVPISTNDELDSVKFSSKSQQSGIYSGSRISNTSVQNRASTTAQSSKTNQMNISVDEAIKESLEKNLVVKETLPYRAADVEAQLRKFYKVHLTKLCADMLQVDKLDADKWQRNLLQIVYQVVRIINPRPRDCSDAFDIRRSVKIKKIYDSSMTAHFEYVDGLVFTKSLVQRQMRSSIHDPSILLLQTGLNFERDSHQLTTLDVLVHQESEQIHRDIAQIKSLEPTVLLCGGSISMMARKQLIANNISASSCVKPHTLKQVARFTRSNILSSVDSLSLFGHRNKLGTCRNFASFTIHSHKKFQKTFICFSGCDPIGCTLLIRDSNYGDLIKVKRILKTLIMVAYDGLMLSQYLLSVRVNPHSFDSVDCSPAFPMRITSPSHDTSLPLPSNKLLSPLKKSKSFTRTTMSAAQSLPSDSTLAALDLSFTSPWSKSNLSAMDAAFSLSTSGLLSLNPLIRLPDPLKKSALFEKSSSRTCFDSSLFSLFGSSFFQGKKPLFIENPSPPSWNSKCLPNKYHAFFTTPLVGDFEGLLADFRRNGFLYDIQPETFKRTIPQKVDSEADSPGVWIKPLNIFESQTLHVLTSTFSFDSQLSPFRYCDGPRLVSCPFHAKSDLSFGAFLENQCFLPAAVCPRRNCGSYLIDHVRHFAANFCRLEIVVRTLEEAMQSNELVTWSMCKECRVPTPVVEVDDKVWGMPLAVFLYSKFYGIDFTSIPAVEGDNCTHLFSKNFLQFFAKGNLVAVVKCVSTNVYDVVIPEPIICLESLKNQNFEERRTGFYKLHDQIAQAVISHFDVVQAYLENCKIHLLNVANVTPTQPAIDLMTHNEEHLTDERMSFVTKMAAFEVAITDPGWDKDSPVILLRTTEQIMFELQRSLYQSWLDWNERLKNYVRFLKSQGSSSNANTTFTESAEFGSVDSPINAGLAERILTSTPSFARNLNNIENCVTPENTRASTALLSTSSKTATLGKQVLEFLTDAELFKAGIFKTKLKLPMKSPFDQSIHYVYRNQTYLYPVVVYDNEPSSLISFALSTEEYFQKLKSLTVEYVEENVQRKNSLDSSNGSFEKLDTDELNENDTSRVEFGSNLDPVDTISIKGVKPTLASRRPVLDTVRFVAPDSASPPADSSKRAENTAQKADSPQKDLDAARDPHIRISWTDAAANKESVTKFSVTIYHAAIFAEIRKHLIEKDDSEDTDLRGWLEISLIRSLNRCTCWAAPGGKSGQRFFRTMDNRLVLKQLFKEELKTALKLAPDYASVVIPSREQNVNPERELYLTLTKYT